jgi:hypothetical protein
MAHQLTLRYASNAELAAYLKQARFQDSLMLTGANPPAGLAQFDRLVLAVELPGHQASLETEVLQLLPDGNLVLRLLAPAALDALVSGGAPASPAAAPARSPEPSPSAETASPASIAAREHTGPVIPAGMGPASWPIEKLQSDWDRLSIADRVNVAKHGSLAARRMIMKMQDRQLHQYVLANPAITAEEVASIASMTNLAPELLKQIAGKPEWTRSAAVARNLICHPKLPQDVVARLLGLLPDLELRKLIKAGRVRDSVKRLILRKVEP